ncbi:hypothetical protein [Plebeiibacterium sediminum]|uniref:Uncharacterized protein n=1 Tax=Plebeiibacterium sediminum TaxID=2992112 RepID=A0AAE3M631_9BACT|nr:hypothetical protein [Plebeiobacterium sediminum]MCW3787859.1 hypothetical protein [Plebeiobacterium sediminum]
MKFLYFLPLILFSVSVASQNKKEVQFTLDTLNKAHENLLLDYQDLQQQWKEQNQFFEHVKSNFFPAEDINISVNQAPDKFDSIYNDIIKKVVKLGEINSSISDSLRKEISLNQELIAKNKVYSDLILSALNSASFPSNEADIIGKWELFLNPVMIQGNPYESGIIGYNTLVVDDSISVHNITMIEFEPEELATIYFTGGIQQKCFYSINNFSKNSPYSIQFSKQDEFKMTLVVSPMPNGLMVSYEAPNKTDKVLYFYGLMKK